MKVYTVQMYRDGDMYGHSYCIGVFSKRGKALAAADAETEYRGGEYYPLVLEREADKGNQPTAEKNYKVVVPLPNQWQFIYARLKKAKSV